MKAKVARYRNPKKHRLGVSCGEVHSQAGGRDFRIRYVQHAVNIGLEGNFRRVLELGTGE
jgi:hypothetical protein